MCAQNSNQNPENGFIDISSNPGVNLENLFGGINGMPEIDLGDQPTHFSEPVVQTETAPAQQTAQPLQYIPPQQDMSGVQMQQQQTTQPQQTVPQQAIPMQPQQTMPQQAIPMQPQQTMQSQIQAPQIAPVEQPVTVQPDSTHQAPVMQPAAQFQPATAASQPQPAAELTSSPTQNLVNLFDAVVEQSDEQNAASSIAELVAKPPMFVYAAIREELSDPAMTFEQLRTKMAADLPELEDRGHVSWMVEYGGVSEKVSTPDKTTIYEVKSRIEQGKKLKETLKKRKKGDKEIACEVKPSIFAQKKGKLPLPSYKGMFESMSDAQQSLKAICYVPGQNGRVYEMRRNEIGTFIAPAKSIAEFEEVAAGFIPALPKIPYAILAQTIQFFRAVSARYEQSLEALVNVLWDRKERCYTIHVPRQKIGGVSVITDMTDAFDETRYLHVMDIHSHNTMPARFSAIDDRDEQAVRLYMVIGRLNRYLPELRCRFACGRRHIEITADEVFEYPGERCPAAWLEATSEEAAS